MCMCLYESDEGLHANYIFTFHLSRPLANWKWRQLDIHVHLYVSEKMPIIICFPYCWFSQLHTPCICSVPLSSLQGSPFLPFSTSDFQLLKKKGANRDYVVWFLGIRLCTLCDCLLMCLLSLSFSKCWLPTMCQHCASLQAESCMWYFQNMCLGYSVCSEYNGWKSYGKFSRRPGLLLMFPSSEWFREVWPLENS